MNNNDLFQAYNDGLMTGPEVLIHLSTGVGIERYADIVQCIAVSMHNDMKQKHWYVLKFKGESGLFSPSSKKLTLLLTEMEAAKLNECLLDSYLLHSEMAEHIRKIDEDKGG